ncbi:MAG: uncharacterized protein K0S45_2052 [Nitrospira sp.]|jgi:uncharacterized protein YbgA (DUF1722 family)/uncharacterized protein YbbK (DUF523 family)|nr:uncharacterized protein [Nitrospira sp.]
MMTSSLRIGISRCLLGEAVRFDGGHKRDEFLADLLGRYVEWVPVCPEVEAGLGTPREAMRLVGDPEQPRLVTIKSGQDHTDALETMILNRLPELERLALSGYVFKKDSPSCGVKPVRTYNEHGMPEGKGIGLFARAFMSRFPLIPVEEEERLRDPLLREHFIERVFSYHRWQDLIQNEVASQAVVGFHRIHKYLLLAHSARHYQLLGRLVAQANEHRPRNLALRYGELFMQALAVKATVRKHVNVLQHILGYFKEQLGFQEKAELLGAIGDYHQGLAPLIVPVALVRHYVEIFNVGYIRDQVYLHPHPEELMLRNHVYQDDRSGSLGRSKSPLAR